MTKIVMRTTLKNIAGIALGFILISPAANAEQLSFTRKQESSTINFYYQWQDQYRKQHELQVSFDKPTFLSAFRTFKLYKPDVAAKHTLMAMRKEAAQVDPKQATIRVRKRNDEISVQVRSQDKNQIDKWLARFKTLQQQSFEQYLNDNYYIEFTNTLRQQGVKPNHVKFARDSVALLQPLVKAFQQLIEQNKLNQRSGIELVASWVQSIPYDTLENRLTSNGAGFAPPNRLMLDNKGDCDSKTVLAAALLHGLYPDMPMTYIFLPNHALMAVSIPHKRKEQFITYQGNDYFYLEPVGPAPTKLHELSPLSQRAIGNQQQQFETITF
ncbi:hypothetical protein [Neptunicella marina]|uniref:Transglutaminase-like superfamily protein n=1 Tax=Neptunicella marina TaxID=2125989 RepID=A0A8J6IUN7_9ALTE|nr:hypothetical protein [Neptunicella marina]MBC3766247.1 hypothetical protein [Neptunicella marina]